MDQVPAELRSERFKPLSALRGLLVERSSRRRDLMGVAVLALFVANSPFAPVYFDILEYNRTSASCTGSTMP